MLHEQENRSKHQPNTTTTITNLPREINLEILSRLPIESLLQVICVCRSWRTLAQDPVLASLQFSRSANTYNPCLLLHDIENHLSSLHFSSVTTDVVTMARLFVPMIPQFSITGSCNGLLCLFDPLYREEAYIFNPFTAVYTQLPKPTQFATQQRVATGFGFSSVSKEYKVVRNVYYRTEHNPVGLVRSPPEDSEVEVLTVNKGNFVWRSKGKTSYQIAGEPSNVLLGGRLHWLSHRRGHQARVKIISFDLEDEEFREVPNPPTPSNRRFAIFCTHLVVLRGCLCGVVKGSGLVDIWVMKEYGVQESWVKEFRIGHSLGRAFPFRTRDFEVPDFLVYSSKVRVLCMLENGEILLEHGSMSLISYDVRNESYKVVATERGLPASFKAIVHIGTLSSLDTPIPL